MLAHGVATNTGPTSLRALLDAIKQTLAPDGLAAVTFIHPDSGDTEALLVDPGDAGVPGWRYPGCYRYERAAVFDMVTEAGLVGRPIGWRHPRHAWWLLAHHVDDLPSAAFCDQLSGATLAEWPLRPGSGKDDCRGSGGGCLSR